MPELHEVIAACDSIRRVPDQAWDIIEAYLEKHDAEADQEAEAQAAQRLLTPAAG